MFENIIFDDYSDTPVEFYINIEDCKFGCIFNQRNKDKEKEYTQKILIENKETIKAWFEEWKQERVEKIVNYYVLNGRIYLIKRAYYLDVGEIKAKRSDLGLTILVNPYISNKDILDEIYSRII